MAIGGYGHIGRLIEKTRRIARDSRLAKRHQNLPIRTELEDLLALSIAALFVGHPKVSIRIDRRAVRKIEHPLAPGFQKLARFIELEDRRLGASDAGILVAAVDHIDIAVSGNLNSRDRGPRNPAGRLCPVANSAIAAGQVVRRLDGGLSEGDHAKRE